MTRGLPGEDGSEVTRHRLLVVGNGGNSGSPSAMWRSSELISSGGVAALCGGLDSEQGKAQRSPIWPAALFGARAPEKAMGWQHSCPWVPATARWCSLDRHEVEAELPRERRRVDDRSDVTLARQRLLPCGAMSVRDGSVALGFCEDFLTSGIRAQFQWEIDRGKVPPLEL
jgi:hypothetical protein